MQAAELCISEAPTQGEVLRRTIKTAELYVQAMEAAADSNEKARLKAKCQILLRRAESLKRATAATHVQEGPTSARTLTTKERVILLEGSKLNGFIFWPWESDPDPEEFQLRDGEELFTYGSPPDLARYSAF